MAKYLSNPAKHFTARGVSPEVSRSSISVNCIHWKLFSDTKDIITAAIVVFNRICMGSHLSEMNWNWLVVLWLFHAAFPQQCPERLKFYWKRQPFQFLSHFQREDNKAKNMHVIVPINIIVFLSTYCGDETWSKYTLAISQWEEDHSHFYYCSLWKLILYNEKKSMLQHICNV